MKKALIILIVIVLSCACLTACSQQGQLEDKPSTDTSTESPVLLSKTEKTKYLNERSKVYYGVGRTINVIEDEYLDVDARYSKIFDEDKLLNLNWHSFFVGKMETSNIQASSMKELYSKRNSDINAALSANVGVSIFSAGMKTSFGFATGSRFESVSNEIFHQAYQYYASHEVEIDERTNLSQFKNIIKQTVLDDARNMSPQKFINKYGTHVILAAYYGGKIEYGYYLCNNGTKWDANIEMKAANSISVGIDKLASGKVDSAFSIQSEMGSYAKDTYSRFYANAVGGAAFKALSEYDFITNYGTWVDSMNGKTVENSCIVSLPAKSLVAIWDLFPDEYRAEEDKLSDYYKQYANNISDEFLDRFDRNGYAPSLLTVEVRSINNEVRVAQGNEIYDIIDVPFEYSELIGKNGQVYNNVVIKVELQLKETGTCYQHVYLLDGNRNSIFQKTFEQGGNTLTPYNKYEKYEFTCETTVNELKKRYSDNFRLWLKYRAQGNNWDANEFYVKDVKVTFVFS